MTATFLSPIEVCTSNPQANCNLTFAQPTDLVNQSIPFSFLSVEVSANDGLPHQVQLYTDVSAPWLGDNNQDFAGETITGETVSHRFWLKNQTQLAEVNGTIGYGSVIYSTKQVNYFWKIQPGSFSKHFRSAE